MATQTLRVQRGEDRTQRITVRNKYTGVAPTVALASVYASVRDGDAESDTLIASYSTANPAQILVTDAADWIFEIYWSRTTTAQTAATYWYDVYCVDANGNRSAVIPRSRWIVEDRETVIP